MVSIRMIVKSGQKNELQNLGFHTYYNHCAGAELERVPSTHGFDNRDLFRVHTGRVQGESNKHPLISDIRSNFIIYCHFKSLESTVFTDIRVPKLHISVNRFQLTQI